MKKLIAAGFAAVLLAGAAYATGTHKHSHEEKTATESHGHGDAMAIGRAGDMAKASRTIAIAMLEKDDGSMVFEPAVIQVTKGETLRLSFSNKGDNAHEFVMDEHMAIMDHKKAMERFPEMEHADPNAIHLEPGQSGEIIWTFTNPGSFEFACLIPGHFEAGMKGALTVD